MRKYTLVAALELLAFASHAQLPGSGGPTSQAPTTPDPTDVPLAKRYCGLAAKARLDKQWERQYL